MNHEFRLKFLEKCCKGVFIPDVCNGKITVRVLMGRAVEKGMYRMFSREQRDKPLPEKTTDTGY